MLVEYTTASVPMFTSELAKLFGSGLLVQKLCISECDV